MDGGDLRRSSREYTGAASFPVVNDFPLSVSCNTELFADDSVLYRKITTEDDCVKFQDDLLSAASWCDLWKVTLKSEKCKSLHVTKSKCPLVHQYVINDVNLSIVNRHKHLGIWIESSLGWDSHINYIVGKANRVLGLIRTTTLINPALDFVPYLLESFSRVVADPAFNIPSDLEVTEVLQKLVPQ